MLAEKLGKVRAICAVWSPCTSMCQTVVHHRSAARNYHSAVYGPCYAVESCLFVLYTGLYRREFVTEVLPWPRSYENVFSMVVGLARLRHGLPRCRHRNNSMTNRVPTSSESDCDVSVSISTTPKSHEWSRCVENKLLWNVMKAAKHAETRRVLFIPPYGSVGVFSLLCVLFVILYVRLQISQRWKKIQAWNFAC